ncbi:hypothetical protein H4R24_005577 [Coemansia sp. RSA 988]|nr:hypothetical protein H4R24_005577 [Coemansia sp. RSA 988]
MSAFQPVTGGTSIAAIDMSRAYESSSPSATMHLNLKPKKKRLNHNELERKRRHHQREVLYELRDVIPTLHIVKPSTVLIMQKAKEYIDLLRRTIQEMDVEINDLRRALVAAGYPLPMPTQQQAICDLTTSQPTFADTSQPSQSMPEQIIDVSSHCHLTMDQHAQLPLTFSDISLARAHFDAQNINNISQLHSVLSKSSAELGSVSERPISPVSPYQLDQAQEHMSSEFKRQLRNIQITPSNSTGSVATTPGVPVLGAHV